MYYNETVYRNAYCAICNLGDDIIDASTDVFSDSNISSWVFDIIRKTGAIKIDVNNKLCVSPRNIAQTSHATWGAINIGPRCSKLPFDIECENETSWLKIFPSSNLSLDSFCSKPLVPNLVRYAKPDKLAVPYLNYTPPSYAALLFSDVKDLPLQIVLNSSWKTVQGSAGICSNESLIEASTGLVYKQFRLTLSGVQVNNHVI